MYRIGIDLGGTNIAIAIVDENANIVLKESIKTNAYRGPEAITADMAALTKKLIKEKGIKDEEILGVGIGSPGTIDADRGVVVTSNNIVMTEYPMVKRFMEHYNKPTFINNDANCAALGEMVAGAAKGHNIVVMITLGTGIGGGIIIDGKIFGGRTNAGAELGHTVIGVDGRQCTCGRKGCWEAYASATALIKQGNEKIAQCPDSLMAKKAAAGERVTGKLIFDSADEGDKAAKEVVDKYIEYVAEGITNIANVFQPEVILVGGGIAYQGEKLLAPIREYVKRDIFTKGFVDLPVIKRAELGNDAGIIGAAMLVK